MKPSTLHVAALFFVIACGDRRSPAPSATAASSQIAVMAASAVPSTSASTAPSAFVPPKHLLEKTKVPMVKEWQSAAETPVLGAAALGCDAKMVREWVRVSCRDANAAGAAPSGVEVTQGAGPEVYTFTKNGVASIVTRFLPGTALRATFSWDDKTSFPLTLSFDAAATVLPAPIGRFEGVSADAPAASDRKGECYCFRYMYGGGPAPNTDPGSCLDVPSDAFVPECLRGQTPEVGNRESCNPLLECQTFEPTGHAECLPEEIYVGICPTCRCGIECGPGKPRCKKGFDCVDNFGRGNFACMPR